MTLEERLDRLETRLADVREQIRVLSEYLEHLERRPDARANAQQPAVTNR